MKSFNKLTAIFCLFAGLVLGSCDDDLSKVGTSILPPGDLITVYSDTFQMKASTVRLDSVFAKTTDCLLGEMYDPVYGNIKADFLCQFYCEEDFKFTYTPYEGKIDSIELIMFYSFNAYGDTLAPMQLSVYPITNPLKRNFYTNDNPEIYCDMTNPIGVKPYTARDMSVSDSLYFEEVLDPYTGQTYRTHTPTLRVKLSTELGQKIYDETINNPSTFKSQGAFNEFFPGLYVTNTFGSGCIIRTSGDDIAIQVRYKFALKDVNGEDSLAYASELFRISKDVIQINRFENNNLDKLLEENNTHTYVKSPAGVCTRLVLPTTEISKEFDVSDRFVNGFSLNLKYMPEDEWDFAYTPPSHLLLIPEDSVVSFFEDGRIENYYTSFISYGYESPYSSPIGYDASTRTYYFGNISSLLKEHMKNSPEKDLGLLVMPVKRLFTNSNNAIYTQSILNSFDLSGIKIRTEDEYMKVVILSSKFENK